MLSSVWAICRETTRFIRQLHDVCNRLLVVYMHSIHLTWIVKISTPWTITVYLCMIFQKVEQWGQNAIELSMEGLSQWVLNKMAGILQRTFSNVCSWMGTPVFGFISTWQELIDGNPVDNWSSICSDNGLSLNRAQATIWLNYALFHWHCSIQKIIV